MSIQTQPINNGESGSVVRAKINTLFAALINGTEGINNVWSQIRELAKSTRNLDKNLEEVDRKVIKSSQDSITYTDRQTSELLQYINALKGNAPGVITNSSYNPQVPLEDEATFVTVGSGTFTYFKDSNGNPIVVSGNNTITIFYKASGVNYWTYKSTTVSSINVVQTTGTSTTDVMSQASTTEKLTEVESEAIYDVSAHNNGAVFESLQSLLGNSNLDSFIPISVRCGGMNIRFIDSNNKYVQYRYTGIETTGNPNPFLDNANWKCTDCTIIVENTEEKEFILPNVLNRWGTIKSLAIYSFQGAQEGCVNEYMLEFTVSGDDFTLALPEGVHWTEEPTWENGYTYQVSIVDNLAVFAGWEVQTNE